MNVIGVNVREVAGRARPIVAPAETGRTAFLIRSARGPAHTPVGVRGFAEFARVFGGLDAGTQGAAVIESYFGNGGAEAVCVRVTRPAAAAAALTLDDRAGAATLRIEAGWRGRPNPGPWAGDVQISVEDNPLGSAEAPAQVVSLLGEPFALADGDTLDVAIDGAAASTVTFSAGLFADITQATAAEVAAVIRGDAREATTAAATGGRVLIASRLAGPSRRVEISGGAAATLGFTAAASDSDAGLIDADVVALRGVSGFGVGQAVRVSTRGRAVGTAALGASTAIPDGASMDVTVDGGAAVTIAFGPGGRITDLGNAAPDEIVAEINRQARGFRAALTPNGELTLASLTVGAASSIALAAGATDALAPLFLSAASITAGLSVASTIVERSDAGGWIRLATPLPNADPLPAGDLRVETAEVDIVVARDGVEQERFSSVGMEASSAVYAPDVINDAFSGSDLIRAVDLASASDPAIDLPALATLSAMITIGTDPTPTDADYAGNAASRTGLHALDTEDFELLALTDTVAPGPAAAAIDYCADKGTAIAIVTGPEAADLAAMIDYAAPLRSDVSYGVAIWPHGRVFDPLDTTGARPLRTIPIVGAYAGMLARVGRESGVWSSPAGGRARIDVAGLVPGAEVTDTEHTDAAVRGGVSVIRALPGQGIIADAARNLSTNAALRLVSARRTTNLIKASLGRSLRLFLQEPINERLFAQVRDSVGAFMTGLWRAGAFGTENREDAFLIICDPSNNPETQTQLGVLAVEVRFRTAPSAEFVIVEISQSPAETVATETS